MACLADVTKGTSNFKLGVIDGAGSSRTPKRGLGGGKTTKRTTSTGISSYLLSAIPANALYQAKKAATIPKPPPALVRVWYISVFPFE